MNNILILVCFYVFAFGMIVGSFLNVCIYRIPKEESVVFPPSHCPNCDYKIKWYDNIPIISYFILLRGKCRSCGEKISIRYPLVEVLTGILVLLVFIKYQMSLESVKFIILTFLLVVLSFIDIDHFWLPDKITLPMIVIGILLSFVTNIGILGSIYGAIFYSLPLLLMYLIGEYILKKDIMGFGDVKLAAGIGAFIGYNTFNDVYWFFMISCLLGSVIGVGLILAKIKTRKDLVPFGPYLAVAGYIIALYGKDIERIFNIYSR